MKRFNLLLVNADIRVAQQIVKMSHRIFKDSFVFEVENVNNAEKLLSKLKIDLIVVDLDYPESNLPELQGRFPGKRFMGLSSGNAPIFPFNASNTKLLHKDQLSTEFLSEMKAIKKARLEQKSRLSVRQDANPNFNDYNVLAFPSRK